MIRDTSAQDRPLSHTGRAAALRRWLPAGAGALVLLALGGWVVSGWSAGSRSYDASRIRIAEVKRGDLVRDLSADGKVITANSPVLYAVAGGTVSLKVVAGDVVEKGQVLAVIDSPELRSRLAQEESTLAGMEAEASRAQLDARIASLNASKARDQAQIDHVAAQRDLERYERAHAGGAVSNNELARAQDELEKARIGLEAARSDARLQEQAAALDARNKRLLADRQKAVVAELQRQVELLTVRAPFDGQVGQVQVAQGTNVAINAPILSVVDLSEFEVEIRVPESFARDLGIGVPAQVTSQGKPWPAKVSAVSPEVVNGEVTARLRFDEGQQPQLQAVDWGDFLARLQRQISFELDGMAADLRARVDPAQMEQALLNLLKNAHEAGEEAGSTQVQVRLRRLPGWTRLEVLDRGPGMNEAVLQNALLPFYSTKRNGTGLGLALTREIVEAHGGRLSLQNRADGGLCVAVMLPEQ